MDYFLAMLIGIFLNTIAIRLILQYRTLSASGVVTDGIIYGPAASGSGVLVRFKTEEGDWLTEPDRNRITGSFMKTNDRVIVIYNRSIPQNFMIRTKYTNMILAGFALAGTGLIIFGILSAGGSI